MTETDDAVAARTETAEPVEAPAERVKCADCGLPENRIVLCDRWDCKHLAAAYAAQEYRLMAAAVPRGGVGELRLQYRDGDAFWTLPSWTRRSAG